MNRGFKAYRRAIFVLLAFGAGFGLGACNSPPTKVTAKKVAEARAQPSAAATERMPAFDLKDIHGRTVTSAQFRGKVVLLDFWATWCAPCKTEMPGYERLYRQYRNRGLVVIGIAADSDPAIVATFGKELKITYPLLVNGMDLQPYGVKGLPTTMLIDRDGIIQKEVVGFEYTATFESALRRLL